MDTVADDGKIHDEGRIRFLSDYLDELERAADEGADIRGYFLWTLMDNFEWSRGYEARFGIVYTDYGTMERIPNDSAVWYRDYIKSKTPQK